MSSSIIPHNSRICVISHLCHLFYTIHTSCKCFCLLRSMSFEEFYNNSSNNYTFPTVFRCYLNLIVEFDRVDALIDKSSRVAPSFLLVLLTGERFSLCEFEISVRTVTPRTRCIFLQYKMNKMAYLKVITTFSCIFTVSSNK